MKSLHSLSDHDRAWPVGIFNTQIPVSQPAVDNCFFCFTENGKIFFRFSVLHKYQISFFFLVARIAFGWSRESPSRSHRSCWRVISLASDGERGHWKRPSPSSLLCIDPSIPVMVQGFQLTGITAAEQEYRFGIRIQLVSILNEQY